MCLQVCFGRMGKFGIGNEFPTLKLVLMTIDKKSTKNSTHYTWGEQCDGWHLLDIPLMSVKQERIPQGAGEKWHGHLFANQFFYVISGEATFELDGKVIVVSANESLHIPPKKLHRVTNRHTNDLNLLLTTIPVDVSDRIDMIDYEESLNEPFKKLNLAWISKYFEVESMDEMLLSNPVEQIINKGGSIFGAKRDNKVLGVGALLRNSDDEFELGKMAVTESERGTGVGHLLMDYAIQKAKELQIKKLILYSNTSLQSAIHLYRKYEFVEVPIENSFYKRSNIKMEKEI